MHLKNYSLFNDPVVGLKLAAGYDLLSTRLVIPEEKDPEELALTLTGKKSNLNPDSFKEFGEVIGLNSKQVQNIQQSLMDKQDIFIQTIEKSFLSEEMKELYRQILLKRFKVLKP
jgi:serine/threonine-protein kinase HipA